RARTAGRAAARHARADDPAGLTSARAVDLSTALWDMSATELAAATRAKRVSAVEVTDAVLARIDRVNPVVKAFVTVAADQAREAARDADAAVMRPPGDGLRPLHGVPAALEDPVVPEGNRHAL